MSFNYQGTYIIKTNLKCITGLHIGGSKESFEIGGIDNPVIKTPISIKLEDREIKEGMPYIPGSSLKGKIRSLLEWQYGLVGVKKNDGKIKHKIKYVQDENTLNDVAIVFGIGANLEDELKNKKLHPQPVRIKFYDAYPTKDTINKWEEELGAGLYTEIKTENAIDRITSAANPRQQERVPAGSEFEVEIIYEVFDDNDHNRLKIVFEGMKRLEDNFLGGGGSRGNGRVKFGNIKIKFKSKEAYTNPSIQPKEEEFGSVDKAIENFEKIKKLTEGK
ncbi:MAG: type III-A CRISPR-associated RAMP protein Csm3 [Aquificae bacterium]|nr:type III-A CRISPR-associated RAMP protein Csm3 [Aquificota bacterium]